jgi:hypothetical protein
VLLQACVNVRTVPTLALDPKRGVTSYIHLMRKKANAI